LVIYNIMYPQVRSYGENKVIIIIFSPKSTN
jgi:hypothetical protein